MGQAKLRGTFEERKAQAIAEGRVKEIKISRSTEEEIARRLLPNYLRILLAAGAMPYGKKR